jgi:serine/threonine-protein kinase
VAGADERERGLTLPEDGGQTLPPAAGGEAERAAVVATLPPGPVLRQRIGERFEILGLLGQGGMGSVYKARDTELGEVVALKMLHPDVSRSPARLERFRQEVRLARRVTHASVARTYDIGEHGTARFLTMEYVEGESLEALLQRERPLSLARTMAVVVPLCEGLAAAHGAGVVHRDLKPANILLARSGRVVITDFGVARDVETAVGAGGTMTPIGTPSYMAPEQVEAGPVDGRTDVYALGVMLFEMLTGERPWKGDSLAALLMTRLLNPPPDAHQVRPEVRPEVAGLVRRCMARQPADRPAGAAEVAAELGRLLADTSGSQVASSARLAAVPSHPWTAGPLAAGTASLAVLPFRNAGAAEEEHWADGFTEDLIETLSLVPRLKVHSRGAVMGLKGSSKDPRHIGQELGAQAIVEGSVRRHGSAMRIQARLVSAADGFQIWAQRFERPSVDLLAVADEVSAQVAAALATQLTRGARPGFADTLALELYLKARQAYHEVSSEGLARARDLFEQALTHAPGDARIMAGYAMTCTRAWLLGPAGHDEIGNRARHYAESAARANPDLAEPHLAIAHMHNQWLRGTDAARELVTALAKNPQLGEAHDVAGRLLMEVDALPEAARALERALSCEPNLVFSRLGMAQVLALAGDWEAEARYRIPDSSLGPLAMAEARRRFWREGDPRILEELRAVARHPMTVRVLRAVLDGADDVFPVEAWPRRLTFFGQMRIEYLSATGAMHRASQLLGEAVGLGLLDVAWLRRCPVLAPLRADPSFAAHIEAVEQRAAPVRAVLLGG